MLLPIRPICTAKRTSRDGTSPIFLQYCYSTTKRTLLNTGINIPPEYWQPKQMSISSKLPLTYGDAAKLNQDLIRYKRVVEDLVTHAINKEIVDKGRFVKETFSPSFDLSTLDDKVKTVLSNQAAEKKAKLDIYYQFDEYIKTKERKVSRATLTVYGNVKSHLLAFEKYRKEKITFIKTIGKMALLNQRIKFSYKKGNKSIEVIKQKYDWITSHCEALFLHQ
jgi:hypothetical protein